MKYLNLILIAVLTALQGAAVPATYKNPIIMESVPIILWERKIYGMYPFSARLIL